MRDLERRLLRIETTLDGGGQGKTWTVWANPGTSGEDAIKAAGIERGINDQVLVISWLPTLQEAPCGA